MLSPRQKETEEEDDRKKTSQLRCTRRVVLEPRVHRLDLVLHALDGLEVLDGLDLELGGRVFVGDDERPGVQLYGGEGPLCAKGLR